MPRYRYRRSHIVSFISLGVFLAGLTIYLSSGFHPGHAKSVNTLTSAVKETNRKTQEQAGSEYGKLPLSFIANKGQADARVKYTSRGSGYSLSLTSTDLVLTLTKPQAGPNGTKDKDYQSQQIKAAQSCELKVNLLGARPSPDIGGLDELPGKVNYLLGNNPGQWRTNIPTYSRVKYHDIYPGIDLIYYGNQQQLEYDFLVSPGVNPNLIRIAFQGMQKLSLSKQGNLVLKTKGGEVSLQKPFVYQELNGVRREVPSHYVLKGRSQVGFEIGSYDRTRPLIIDPVLSYSTYLGGTGTDKGLSIAVDSSGAAFITGQTYSANFPVAGSLQQASGGDADVFVTKLNPTGSAIVYSTFIGGSSFDSGNGIALDSAGNAYLTGSTNSSNFPTANALHPVPGGVSDAFVAELNSTGSALIYSTYLGGSDFDGGNGIAVDAAGNAYVTGQTVSRNFPVSNALQPNKLGNSIFKSTDGTGSWNPSDAGLAGGTVYQLVFDPQNSTIIYAATDSGVYKSTNSGSNWTLIGAGQTPRPINRLAISPSNPSIMYVTTFQGVYRSADGGNNWQAKGDGFGATYDQAIVIDPTAPDTLYVASPISNLIFKSTDGGSHWSNLSLNNSGFVFTSFISALAIDPTSPSTIYAGANSGIQKSTNGGGSWSIVNTGLPFLANVTSLVIDKNNPATIFAATNGGVFKSTNGGNNWAQIFSNQLIATLVLDPASASTIYAIATYGRVFKTTDGGNSWNQVSTINAPTQVYTLLIDPANPLTTYYGAFGGNEAFVTKLAPGGASQTYSTYLGGSADDAGYGIAADASGNAYIVGSTTSTNFPVANAFQANKGDSFTADAFITKLNSTGSALIYSTYLGGDNSDVGRSIALDANGNVYTTGSTASTNFPTAGALQSSHHGDTFNNDAFVTKLNAAGSALVYSTYLGGSSEDVGYGIAVATSGDTYITGSTFSPDFPAVSSIQTNRSGSTDAFVTKLNPSGASIVYSTFVGGNLSDEGRGVAVDPAGDPYVAGTTSASDFPLANPLQTSPGGSSDAFVLKLHPAVDLSVTMTDSPDPVILGNNLTYTITVKNEGDVTATGVTLTDTLPSGATFVSASGSQGTCSGQGPVTCNLGSLNQNATATITITVKPPAVKTITNTASVTCAETEPKTSNNTVTEDTQVTFADPSITAATAHNKVAPGSSVNYIFTVKNNSGSTAESVTLTDNLPPGTTFVSCSAQGGVCGGAGNNRTVTFSSLAVGQPAIAVLVATVDNSVAEGTVLSNMATVASSTPDADPGNNSATATVTATLTPLRQRVNGKIVFPGTDLLYTIKDDGSEAAAPIPNTTQGFNPVWSPDGTKLAFIVIKTKPTYPFDSYAEIDVVNADGTGLTPIADNSADSGFDTRSRPDWSPDGTRIAYVGKDRTIYIANSDGTGFAKLPNSPSQVRDIDWSPDGSRLLFSILGEIHVMNIDGSGLTKLLGLGNGTDGTIYNYVPSWSPDMSRILFYQKSTNRSDVAIMNGDGTGVMRLLNVRPSDSPIWSPDGTKVAFYKQTEIHVANLDGAGDITLVTGQGCCNSGAISWQPIPTNNPLPPPQPPSQTYSITGRITNNIGFFFSTVTLSGTRNATLTTETDGSYQFVNLPAGGHYTVTPSSVAYNFNPTNRTIDNLNANQTGVDFAGTYIPVSISGHVRDTNGNPLPNVKVVTSDGFPQGETLTDANGYYVFPNRARARSYVVYVQQGSGAYTYAPDAVNVPNLNTDQTVDFVGTRHPSNKISGRITSGDAPNVGVSGVQVVLARDINQAAITYTDANGNYNFGDQISGYDYSVFVSAQSGSVFTPGVIKFKYLNADRQANFVRYPFSSYTGIGGKVVDAQGNALDGVTLTLSGAFNSLSGTGSNGAYSFFNIPAGFNYVLTPSKPGYVFTPAQQSINNLSSSNGQQINFTAAPIPTVQMGAASYTVAEGSSNVMVTVNRSDSSTAASVDYATNDAAGLTSCGQANTGLASSRCDYATTVGTLHFAAGESSRTISIPLVDDGYVEGNESFILTLSNPSGAGLGANSTATVVITDNDATATNPIVGVPYFVRQQYIDFLGREPDPGGFAAWQNILNNCAAGDTSCDRIAVSSGFFRSPEFQQRGYFIYKFYSAALGRKPDYAEFMPDLAKVSGFLSDAQLEANKVAFVNEFMTRTEYTNRYGSLGNTAFVDTLIQTAGLQSHPLRDAWVGLLNNGGATKAEVLRAFTESVEVYNKFYNEAFVVMQYFGYLRRDPDASYLQWIQTMNSNGGDYRAMISGFINSNEYVLRFGP